jgi:sugar lactone lactonase YvrE
MRGSFRLSRAGIAFLALFCLPLFGCGATLFSVLGALALGKKGGGGGRHQSPPAVAIEPIPEPVAGDVTIRYRLIDAESDPASLFLRYSLDGGRSFAPLGPTEATGLGSDGVSHLETSPTGKEHAFVWNSFFDIGARNLAEVVLEITPRDAESGAEGPPQATPPFALSNAWIATVSGGPAPRGTEGFGLPSGLAALEGASGRALALFVADPERHRVERIDLASGAREVVAGTGEPGFDGDHRPAAEAKLFSPRGVAVDRNGDLFIADTGNHRVRRVAASTGFISTVAGSGVAGFSGDGGLAEEAALDGPTAVALDALGDLYIVDAGNGALRAVNRTPETIGLFGSKRVEPAMIETVARLAGGPGSFALFSISPIARAFGGIAIRGEPASDPANSTLEAFLADSARGGAIRIFQDGTLGHLGPETGAALDLALEADAVIVADAGSSAILRVPLDLAAFEWIAGIPGKPGYAGDGGPAKEALLDRPAGVFLAAIEGGSGGNVPVLFIADSFNRAVRAVNRGSEPVEVAGIPIAPDSIDTIASDAPEPKTQAVEIARPAGIALAPDGSLYVADFEGGKIVRVHPVTRATTTLASGLLRPFGIVVEPGGTSLLVSESGRDRILRVAIPSGATLNAIADAGLKSPAGLALAEDGTLFVADTGNHRVCRIPPGGSIETYVGTGEGGFNGDGPSDRLLTRLFSPAGVALGENGKLYVADTGNHRVRVVDEANATTIVNRLISEEDPPKPLSGYNGDNRSAASALLSEPLGLAVRGRVLLVADSGNDRIRRVSLDSLLIATAAGIGAPSFNGDAIPPEDAAISSPSAIAIDEAGNVFFSDAGNLRVRRFLGSFP